MALERFLQAQAQGGSYERALAELKAGRKTGHWIWWVFPQLKGLGSSHNSTYYGLDDEAEAAAYLTHPVLGLRYRECVEAVHVRLCDGVVSPLELMGSEVDVLKLRASLGLFRKVVPQAESGLIRQIDEILPLLD